MATLLRISGRNLEERDITLPDDLAGDMNILLIGYERWQQELIDGWKPHVDQLAQVRTWLKVYELAVLRSSYRLLRGFIDGGMRLGIPNRNVREATITLYTNVDDFNRAVGIATTDTIAVVVVDVRGTVVWSTHGSYTPQRLVELQNMLVTIRGEQHRPDDTPLCHG